MKTYLIAISLLFNGYGQMKNDNQYIKYQTFDEYKLIGVGTSNIKGTYVLVKKNLDTISVIKSNDIGKVIKYINKGVYWYSKSVKEVDTIPFAKQRLTPTVYEKFIFNDTIIEYKYLLESNLERWNQAIFVHTKKECVILSIQDNDIKNYDDPYNEIKGFAINYKNIIPLYSPDYQPRYYTMFEKRIEGNVLSIYEIGGDGKNFVESKKMNNLGEFDYKWTLTWWW